MNLKRKNNKGFTLIEIIVVLVIMVIMAAIAIPAVTGYIKDAKNSKYVQETHSIYTVVQTEEAKAKALNTGIYESNIANTNAINNINEKLSDTGIAVSSIIKTDDKYTIEFTSDNDKTTVTAKFTANSDDMTITTKSKSE